ncbi:MAG: hypothetical protein LBL71_02630 [Endomicrobium sp.]|jgi:hypothetical protein|nr:hypothetical protein [Endomicrobium sp.]
MKTVRGIMTVLSAFLLALPPVQAVGEKKVRMGYVNDRSFSIMRRKWELDPGRNIDPRFMELFESEKGKEAFESFVKAARDDYGIMKIIDIPEPLADFIPNVPNGLETEYPRASRYLDLKTGGYKSDPFNRVFIENVEISFEVDLVTYRCSISIFEVEESKTEDINNILIFNPCREPQASPIPTDVLPEQEQSSAPPEQTLASESSKWIFDNGFVIAGVVLAVIGAGGIGLYMRHNRKKDEERKNRKRGRVGFMKRLLTGMNLKTIN